MTHPAIRDLFQSLQRQPVFGELTRHLQATGGQASLSGLTETAKALYLVLLWQVLERPLLVITDSNKRSEALDEIAETFASLLLTTRGNAAVQLIPAFDALPGQRLSPHNEICERRAVGLWRLANGRTPLTIAPLESALYRIEAPDFYRQLALTVRVNEELPLEDLVAHLVSVGYEQRDPVEMVGEYSLRGGILDVFPPESQKPVRMEFFGDLVESLRRFEPDSQRSVLKISECTLLPLVEHARTRPLLRALSEEMEVPVPGEVFPGWEFAVPLVRPRHYTLLDMMENPIVVWDEPERLRAQDEKLWTRLESLSTTAVVKPEQNFYRLAEIEERAGKSSVLLLRELELLTEARHGTVSLHVPARPSMSFHGNMPVAVAEARTLVEQGNKVTFFAPSVGEVERLADIFKEYSVPFQLGLEPNTEMPAYLAQRSYIEGDVASIFLVKGSVAKGVLLPDAHLAVFGSEDLFDTSELVAKPSKAGKSRLGVFGSDLTDLKPGDYVVHTIHGVGRFLGIRELGQGDQKGDFMLLEYSGEAKLYVPLTRLDLVEKFRGAGEAAPTLDRLGGTSWAKTKSRVKAKMRDMAEELIRLYAERKMAEGFAFSPDSNWQREFEDAFEYTATTDQDTALRDIKRDMENPTPMDRLLCGDVGFGKTEVAMRAAFKALGDGKQVALLAPTTVLSFQHYETFKRRFAPFPVRVELASRFRHPKEVKEVLADLADGKVDILIGTHRLLSKDVHFRDLGLLIVDEEQRFGVRHKETLKQIRKDVDVLTMSATPIPRTLHMSLVGMRDMSLIETPPKDRLAIHTVVAHFHDDLIRTAIEQELNRGGQVYFIHNRVDSIYARAAWLQQLMPHVRIGVGHGQMGEEELEKVLLTFMRHECDVFVCTTIAENGLDIPLANTIIIEHADRYGLSQLYQLRGRVGRSNRRAYAYLLVPDDKQLSDIARKRLAALKEFSDLGAGFKIAALDLELRGAGNVLGGEQHGHIEAVGYDTYVRLLDETVRELKGEVVAPEIRSTFNLGLDIRIPADYIHDEHQRLRAYKRIAEAGDEASAMKVLEEMEDRYGPVPAAVHTLMKFSLLKTMAETIGVESVERRSGFLQMKFHPESLVDPVKLMDLVAHTPNAQFTPDGTLRIPVKGQDGPAAVLDLLRTQFGRLARIPA